VNTSATTNAYLVGSVKKKTQKNLRRSSMRRLKPMPQKKGTPDLIVIFLEEAVVL
jgi:hypothetical protein